MVFKGTAGWWLPREACDTVPGLDDTSDPVPIQGCFFVLFSCKSLLPLMSKIIRFFFLLSFLPSLCQVKDFLCTWVQPIPGVELLGAGGENHKHSKIPKGS